MYIIYNATSRYQATFVNGLAMLEVTKASHSDSGEYTCIAKNIKGEARTTCKVKIFTTGIIISAIDYIKHVLNL